MSAVERRPPPAAPDSPNKKLSQNAKPSSSSPAVEQKSGQMTYDLLQMKYLTVDRNYENLKQLTRKGKLAS